MRTISKRHIRTARYAYIYVDGHAVICHKEKFKGVDVEYVTLHEGAFDVHRGKGRLCVHGREALAHLMCADWIGWNEPSLEHGTQNTKEMGIVIADVYCSFMGAGETWIVLMPNLISGEFTPQCPPGHDNVTFAEHVAMRDWDNMPVSEVVRDIKGMLTKKHMIE